MPCRIWLPLVVLPSLLLGCGGPPPSRPAPPPPVGPVGPDPADVRAADVIEKTGGSFTRDQLLPYNPIITVYFQGNQRCSDQTLKDVAALKHLRELNLISTQITDAGL